MWILFSGLNSSLALVFITLLQCTGLKSRLKFEHVAEIVVENIFPPHSQACIAVHITFCEIKLWNYSASLFWRTALKQVFYNHKEDREVECNFSTFLVMLLVSAQHYCPIGSIAWLQICCLLPKVI